MNHTLPVYEIVILERHGRLMRPRTFHMVGSSSAAIVNEAQKIALECGGWVKSILLSKGGVK
jgi:hypothetical protein